MLIRKFQIYNLIEIIVVKKYIKARLDNPEKTDIKEIIDPSRQQIPPSAYSLLQKSQPTDTTASVERSFSKLIKIIAKDRISPQKCS